MSSAIVTCSFSTPFAVAVGGGGGDALVAVGVVHFGERAGVASEDADTADALDGSREGEVTALDAARRVGVTSASVSDAREDCVLTTVVKVVVDVTATTSFSHRVPVNPERHRQL